MSNAHQPADDSRNSHWLFVIILAVLVCLALPYAIFWGSALHTLARQLVLVLTALFCAFLLAAGSVAAIQGTVLRGTKFQVFGIAALFIIIYLVLVKLVPAPETHVVRLYLEHNKQPLNARFTAIVRVPGMEVIKKSGENGEASIELPSHVKAIDSISIDCDDYCLAGLGPFEIVNGVVRLAMRAIEVTPPLLPNAMPSTSAIPDFPSKENALFHIPKIQAPERITLDYKNNTDQDLKLLMIDCRKYYDDIENGRTLDSSWQVFPFGANGLTKHYNGFSKGSGYFGFFVRDATGQNYPLGCYKLFEADTTSIEIEELVPELRFSIEHFNSEPSNESRLSNSPSPL